MPGKKPDRRDYPPGKFGDEDFQKAMVAWEESYTKAGQPIPGKVSGGPGKEKAPPMDISGSPDLAANQGSAKIGMEMFLDDKGRYVSRRTGTEKDKVAVAKGQEQAQEAIAEAAGGEKLDFPEPAPVAPPADASMGDQAKYAKDKRDWVRRREEWALKQPKARKPAKPGGELFPR